MKKFFAVFLLALLPAAVFAGGKQEDNNYLSLNFGVPILWETAEEDGRTVDSRMVSVVTGLSFATYFNDVIGLYTEFDFLFPLSFTWEEGGVSVTKDRGDYDSLFGFSVLIGPSFSFFRTEKTVFALSPGFHYTFLTADLDSTVTLGNLFGVGANLELGYKLTDLIYLRAALEASYDFFGITRTSTHSRNSFGSGSTSNLQISPKVGIGFNF